jgi:hypothetical protein
MTGGGAVTVLVAPVASTFGVYVEESRLLKSHEYVKAPVQFPQLATAEKVIGEPGSPGLGEKVQEALKPFVKEFTPLVRAKSALVLRAPF